MPLLHCSKCHHEWESASKLNGICDWCGAVGYVLEQKTPLERMLDAIFKKKERGRYADNKIRQ